MADTNTNSTHDYAPEPKGMGDPCVGCAYMGGWEATAIRAPDDCDEPTKDIYIHTSVELYLGRPLEEEQTTRTCTSYVILTLLREDIEHSNQDLLNDTLPLIQLVTIEFPAGVGGVRVKAEFPKILADDPTLGVASSIQGMGELRVKIQPYRWNFGVGDDVEAELDKEYEQTKQIELNLNFDDMKVEVHKLNEEEFNLYVDTPTNGGIRG